MTDQYVIYAPQKGLWWAPNERGYVSQIILAGVYSHDQDARGDVLVPLAEALERVCGCSETSGTVLEYLGMRQPV